MKKIPKILLLLITISTLANAAGYNSVIYTWGLGPELYHVLDSFSGLVTSGDGLLIKIATAMAMLTFTIKSSFGGMKMIGFETGKFLVAITLIETLFLSAPNDTKHSFAIVDVTTNYTRIVHQIPIAVGEMLSITTSLENAIMKKMDLYYSVPNSISYRNAGLGFAPINQIKLMRSSITNEYVKETFTQYIKNCKILGDWNDGTKSQQAFMNANANNILNDLATTETLFTTYYNSSNPNGVTGECKDVWNNVLKPDLLQLSQKQLDSLAAAYGTTPSQYNAVASVASQNIVNAGYDANQQIIAAMIRNQYQDSTMKLAAATGTPIAQLARNESIADVTMQNTGMLNNIEANSLIPVMYSTMLFIIIMASWILALISIAMYSPKHIITIASLLFWLMLWGPMFDVVNYIIDLTVQNAAQAIGPATIANQADLFTAIGTKLSVLQNMLWAVPSLALVIATGSGYAMANYVSGMKAMASSAMSSAVGSNVSEGQAPSVDFSNLASGVGRSMSAIGQSTTKMVQGTGGPVKQEALSNRNGHTVKDSGQDIVTETSQNVGGGVAINTSGSMVSLNELSSLQSQLQRSDAKIDSITNSSSKAASENASELHSASQNGSLTKNNSSGYSLSKTNSQTVGKTYSKALQYAANHASGKDHKVTKLSADQHTDAQKAFMKGSVEAEGGFELFGIGGKSKFSTGDEISIDGKYVKTKQDGHDTYYKTSKAFQQQWGENLQKSIQHQETANKNVATAMTEAEGWLDNKGASDVKSSVASMNQAFSEQQTAQQNFAYAQANSQMSQQGMWPEVFKKYLEANGSEYGYKNGKFATQDDQNGFNLAIHNMQVKWSQGGANGQKQALEFARKWGGVELNPNNVKNVNGTNNPNLIRRVDDAIDSGQQQLKGVPSQKSVENSLHNITNTINGHPVDGASKSEYNSLNEQGNAINKQGQNLNSQVKSNLYNPNDQTKGIPKPTSLIHQDFFPPKSNYSTDRDVTQELPQSSDLKLPPQDMTDNSNNSNTPDGSNLSNMVTPVKGAKFITFP